MTTYNERNSFSLLTGSSDFDNDPLTVRQVDDVVITEWPHIIDLATGCIEIQEDGTVTFDDKNRPDLNPNVGEPLDLGSFTYTLWDGEDETDPSTATITLYGTAVPATQLLLSETRPIDDYVTGTQVGTFISNGTDPAVYSVVDADGLPVSVTDDQLLTTGALTAGTYTPVFRTTNAAGSFDQAIEIEVQPAATAIYRGQHDPALRPGPLGGEATFVADDGTVLHPTGSGVYRYVDASVSSSGDGLSLANAYKTVQEGMNAASAGDTILIEPGYYPEHPVKVVGSNMANATDRIKMCRRGGGRVEIGGGDLVSGWTQCVSGDANGNSDFASIYKTTIPDTWAIALEGAVLQQSGEMAFICMTAPGYAGVTENMFSRNDTPKFYEIGTGDAADLTESKTGDIITLTSPTVFGSYAAGDLDDALIMMLHAQGNNTVLVPVSSHNASTGVATIDVGSYYTFNNKFAIVNAVSDLSAPGQWGFTHDSGAGTYTLYFWPYDAAKLDEIRLSARTRGFTISDGDYYTLYGLDFVDTGGDTHTTGYGFLSGQPSLFIDNFTMRECRAARFSNSINVARAMFFDQFTNVTIENNTLEFVQDGGGFNITECSGSVQYNLVQSIGGNGWGNAKNNGLIAAYNKIANIRSAHGNGMSVYLGCQDMLLWGNIFDTKQGIGLTCQESNNIWVAMNLFVVPQFEPQGRAYDNNGAQVPVVTRNTDDFILNGVHVFLNNTTALWPGAIVGDEGSGVTYGQTPSATHHMVNNVTAGSFTREYAGGNFLTLNSGVFEAIAPANVTANFTATAGQTVFTTSGAANAIFSAHTTTVTVNGASVPFSLVEYSSSTSTSTITLDTGANNGDTVVVTAVGSTYSPAVGTIDNNIYVSDLSASDLARLPGTVKNLDPSALWENAPVGIYTPVTSGPLDGTGIDASGLLPTGTWVSGFDFTKDAYGQSFDWTTNAPVGALTA